MDIMVTALTSATGLAASARNQEMASHGNGT
jgi:hypothetical protein